MNASFVCLHYFVWIDILFTTIDMSDRKVFQILIPLTGSTAVRGRNQDDEVDWP